MIIKRFKDYRMFWVCLIILMIFVGLGTYAMLNKLVMQAMGCFLLSFTAVFLLTVRYKNMFFEDAMIIYEWKVAAMLPTAIDFKDITSLERKSKHHLIVHHIKDSHVYVFNSDDFIEYYHSLKK